MDYQRLLSKFGGPTSCLDLLGESRLTLLQILSANAGFLAFKPSPDAWNVLEIAEHIAISEQMAGKILKLMQNPRVAARLHSPPIERRNDGRLIAPKAAQPLGKLNPDSLRDLLCASRVELVESVQSSKIDWQGLTQVRHPFYGLLTSEGWLQSLVYHELHHLKQIETRLEQAKEQ